MGSFLKLTVPYLHCDLKGVVLCLVGGGDYDLTPAALSVFCPFGGNGLIV